MKKIIAMGGPPASGKTTLMREILSKLGFEKWRKFKQGMICGHFSPDYKYLVLGLYEDDVFAGTDRMSMGVMPEAIDFLSQLKEMPVAKQTTLLFEGDRLFTEKFLKACESKAETKIFFIECQEEEKQKRHLKREDSQSETWLKGRETKIENLRKTFHESIVLLNGNEVQLESNRDRILREINA